MNAYPNAPAIPFDGTYSDLIATGVLAPEQIPLEIQTACPWPASRPYRYTESGGFYIVQAFMFSAVRTRHEVIWREVSSIYGTCDDIPDPPLPGSYDEVIARISVSATIQLINNQFYTCPGQRVRFGGPPIGVWPGESTFYPAYLLQEAAFDLTNVPDCWHDQITYALNRGAYSEKHTDIPFEAFSVQKMGDLCDPRAQKLFTLGASVDATDLTWGLVVIEEIPGGPIARNVSSILPVLSAMGLITMMLCVWTPAPRPPRK